MNRRSVLIVSVLGLALLPGNAVAQQKSLKEQLVGTWTFVTSADVQKDGTKVDRWRFPYNQPQRQFHHGWSCASA